MSSAKALIVAMLPPAVLSTYLMPPAPTLPLCFASPKFPFRMLHSVPNSLVSLRLTLATVTSINT
ncbi:hypothetical protein D9M71_795600 [compost metagenome]